MPTLGELATRRQASVDDFVVAKASKSPTDQQVLIQADDPDFTGGKHQISHAFGENRLAWARGPTQHHPPS